MTFKRVTSAVAGDGTHFGGLDVNKFSDYLGGTDISGSESVDIATLTAFRDSKFTLRNPANTFSYVFVPSAIGANRNITLPLLTGNDIAVTQDFTQTIQNKTINATNNTVTDTSTALGDLMVSNGSKFVRKARGSANQLLRTNAGGTDIEWATVSTGTGTTWYPDISNSGAMWGLWSGGARQGTGMFSTCLVLNPQVTNPSAFQGTNTSWQPTTDFVTTTTSGSKSGFQGYQPTLGGFYTTRNQNFRFKVKLQTDVLTNKRIFVGFIGANSVPTATDIVLATGIAGFGFRFSSTTDTTWKVLRNDASGTALTVDSGVTVLANTPSTLEIIADDANSQIGWSINDSAITNYSTDVPSNITPLNYFVVLETKTASSQRFRIYYAYLTQAGA
jgi:hypothetical protein